MIPEECAAGGGATPGSAEERTGQETDCEYNVSDFASESNDQDQHERVDSGGVLFGEVARRAYELGHEVFPCRGKVPVIKNWPKAVIDERFIDACCQEYPRHNVGLRNKVGIDHDIRDVVVSSQMRVQAALLLGLIPARIGEDPKFLIACRCPELPHKLQSRIFVHPDRPDEKNQIEILAPWQQQFIASGIHPGTGRPYRYEGGPSFLETPHDDVPLLTLEDLRAYLDSFEQTCLDAGMVPPGHAKEQTTEAPRGEPRQRAEGGSVVDRFNQGGRDLFRDQLLVPGWSPFDEGKFTFVDRESGEKFTVDAERWTRPGKADGISASLYQHPGTGQWRFTLWSSSVEGLEPGDYLIAHALACLAFNGSYGALLAFLKDQGFGTGAREDFADYAGAEEAEGGQEGEQPGSGQQTGKKRRGFDLISAAAILEQQTELQWIVQNMLPEGCLSSLFGRPGSYKTYAALDIALSVATGTPWHGHAVERGMVVYICGEGFHGLSGRIQAWMIEHGLKDATDIPFFVSTSALPLNTEAGIKALAAKIDALISEHGEPRLVILDTLARCNDGDENAASDMGRLVRNLDDHLPASTARLVLHHVGHSNQERGRGSSAWHGALDSEYLLARQDDGTVALSCSKAKDFPEWERPLTFKVKPVVINVDLDANVVLEQVDNPPPGASTWRPSPAMARALQLLRELAGADQGVDRVVWRDRCIEAKLYASAGVFNTGFARMVQRGLIRTEGVRVFATEAEEGDK